LAEGFSLLFQNLQFPERRIILWIWSRLQHFGRARVVYRYSGYYL
jgi:hypothetical protein